MLCAIIGDMIGAPHERFPIKKIDFNEYIGFPTDDTICTLAIANAILTDFDYGKSLKKMTQKYPFAKYGLRFKRWIWEWDIKPYNSCGNGSAMRVSPIGYAFNNIDDVLYHAKKSAEVSHNHPEGIKGAQSVALTILLARKNKSKEYITNTIEKMFGYNLHRTIDEIRLDYEYSTLCQYSVPESIIAFLDSSDYITAVKNAISLGGDADTMACIAGSIAEAYYNKIPYYIVLEARRKLDDFQIKILDEFTRKFMR
jgi:ADP-ribosylglycohydrolase